MHKLFVIYLLLFWSFSASSQKEANIWYFGTKAGLDFNAGPPVPLLDGAMLQREGCASIADENGDLLFYTNGMEVWNRNHLIMVNGTGLLGDESSTQSAIIIPKPESTSNYYIFTVGIESAGGSPIGLRYSEVDMNLGAGFGAITANKNIQLVTPSVEKLTAVRHANGTDIWVVAHELESDAFYTYLVTSTGVSAPVISNCGTVVSKTPAQPIGQMKISPDRKRLAMAIAPILNVLICDFDASTGIVSNPDTITFHDNNPPYGIEFSPSSELLYTSFNYVAALAGMPDSLFQFDLTAADIQASKVNVKLTDGKSPGSLQLGPDNKIYGCAESVKFLNVINNPDIRGIGCNYAQDALYLGGWTTRLGLPNFISALFKDIPVVEIEDTVVIEEFYLPKAFTPNKDGINDAFFPKTQKQLTAYLFQVFNRWGELIYETTDIKQQWDGGSSPVGTYGVVITYSTETEEQVKLVEDVHLIR